MYQKIVKINDTNNAIYKLIQQVRNINYREGIHYLKPTVMKTYEGGKIDRSKKIDLFKFINLKDLHLLDYKTMDKTIESKYDYIIKKDYEMIRDRICDMESDFWNLIRYVQEGSQYERLERIIKKDEKMIQSIDKMNEIFEELIFLCETISHDELLENLTKINEKYDDRNLDNNSDDDDEDENRRREKYKYFTSFLGPCKFAIKHYELFKKELKKEIPQDKWKYLLVIRFIDYNITYYPKRNEQLDYFKYVFPKLFEECPVDDFIMCYNVNFELTMRFDIEKMKDECKFFDYYGITKILD